MISHDRSPWVNDFEEGTFGVDVLSARHSVTVENGHLELKRLAMLSPAEEVEVLAVSEGATLTIHCGVMMALQCSWEVRDGRRVQEYHICTHIRIRWYSLFLVPRFPSKRFINPCCHYSLFFHICFWGEEKDISFCLKGTYWLTGIDRFCGLWIAWQFLALGLAASAAACAPAPRLKRTFSSRCKYVYPFVKVSGPNCVPYKMWKWFRTILSIAVISLEQRPDWRPVAVRNSLLILERAGCELLSLSWKVCETWRNTSFWAHFSRSNQSEW